MAVKKTKLLIVDDEKDICKFVKLLFKKKGFSVFSALSGKKAINIAKRIKPDIALLDIYLKKKIDGLMVLSKFQEIIPKCRCVIVTWDNAEDKVKKARKLGAVSYLTKPLTTAQLFNVVNKLAQDIRRKDKKNG